MIIPIRCFTCGKVIADQIDYYKKECDKQLKDSKKKEERFKHFSDNHNGEILNKLGVTRYCCRRMFISDVDMMEII